MVQLAEQAVALVEDQVKLEALLNNTDEASAVRETVAAGGVELPPPPPPPQETIETKIKNDIEKDFIINISVQKEHIYI